jgi:hypothetical protein
VVGAGEPRSGLDAAEWSAVFEFVLARLRANAADDAAGAVPPEDGAEPVSGDPRR